MEPDLRWTQHISEIGKKLSSSVYAVRKIVKIAGPRAGLLTYFALFQSVMTYGILAWGRAPHTHLQRLFILQKAAVRSLVGANYDAHCKPIFIGLQVMSLFSYIVFVNVCYVNANLESFKKHLDVHDHDTRGKHNLVPCMRRLRKTTELDVQLFNMLPFTVQTLSIRSFKSFMKKLLTENCLYNIDEFKQVACSLRSID